MKGIIFYYSCSGNTKLAVEYLKSKIKNVEFELFNIIKNSPPDFSKYDVVGFALWADYLRPSPIFNSFIEKIEKQNNKPTFIFNTYGMLSGNTLPMMEKALKSKGFDIIGGHSLHTPESYPPNRKKGWDFDKAPEEKDINSFNEFISKLSSIFEAIKENKPFEKIKIKVGLLDKIIKLPKGANKKDFGIQKVNEELCKECGVCANGCPYEAITLNPKPVFNHEKCMGCWFCYNHCAPKAIYTEKFKGDFQYPKPIEVLQEKLRV